MKRIRSNHIQAATVRERTRGGQVLRRSATLLVIASTVIAATGHVSKSQAAATSDRCPLCAPDLKVPVVPLSAESLHSMARRHASFNARQLARIDSLLRAGYYGPPEEDEARETAHLLARISTSNAYRDLVRLACDPYRVYEADEATLRDLYRRYSDVNLFIGACLERVRLGMGRVCVRYRVGEELEGVSVHGGKQLRWRVRDVKIGGQRRRVLHVKFPTGSDDEVDFFIAPHHTFKVEYTRCDGPPAPFEWFLVHDIEGAWVRKWGMHRPTAYMFWVSPPDTRRLARSVGVRYAVAASSATPAPEPALNLPSTPLVGLRLYIPGLRLRLPGLPDINVNDLREIELPMPILDLDYLRGHQQPSWLDTNDRLGFKNWKAHGPVPAEIRRRFPDR
ncbi:MAG: hypothetical protein OEN01_10930 [Candidatus Krumholzibacteria bacterium]|nr:hypothetical protein [Candidatus Krumholzibacteria bacterium]